MEEEEWVAAGMVGGMVGTKWGVAWAWAAVGWEWAVVGWGMATTVILKLRSLQAHRW